MCMVSVCLSVRVVPSMNLQSANESRVRGTRRSESDLFTLSDTYPRAKHCSALSREGRNVFCCAQGHEAGQGKELNHIGS